MIPTGRKIRECLEKRVNFSGNRDYNSFLLVRGYSINFKCCWWGGKQMGWEDGRLAVRYYIGETIAGCSNGNLSEFRCEHPYRAGEKDLISFPIHLTKGVRSEKIDLYNYNYRRMVDVIVTGRTLVKFQNGSTDTVDIGKKLKR